MSSLVSSAPAIWLTRPVHRARALATELEKRGFRPLIRPAILIREIPAGRQSPIPQNLHLAIFVSAEAAARQPSPRNPAPALAIGKSAADALPANFALAAPPARDSAELAALPILQNIAGKNIAVLGGVSDATPTPSPPLCAELAGRGANVFPISKYRRDPAPPDDGELSRLAESGVLRAATAFSAETLAAMLRLTAPQNEWLRRLPLFVHHRAVARSAAEMAFSDIIASEDMADAIVRKFQPQ